MTTLSRVRGQRVVALSQALGAGFTAAVAVEGEGTIARGGSLPGSGDWRLLRAMGHGAWAAVEGEGTMARGGCPEALEGGRLNGDGILACDQSCIPEKKSQVKLAPGQ